jgi:hypothetical protein
MGEYRIPYEGKVHRYRDRYIGDRGIIDAAEKKALAIARSLLRDPTVRKISYKEIVTDNSPQRKGHILVTFE